MIRLAISFLLLCACASAPPCPTALPAPSDPCAACRAQYNAATRPYVECNMARHECYVPDVEGPSGGDWPPLE